MSSQTRHASDQLERHGRDLLGIANAFSATAGKPGRSDGIPRVLPRLEAALRVLGSSWYELAADAAPGVVERRTGVRRREHRDPNTEVVRSHEQEALLVATLQDVAASLLDCARVCKSATSIAAPLIREPKIFAEDPDLRHAGAVPPSASAASG
jgi:hypothetical protein